MDAANHAVPKCNLSDGLSSDVGSVDAMEAMSEPSPARSPPAKSCKTDRTIKRRFAKYSPLKSDPYSELPHQAQVPEAGTSSTNPVGSSSATNASACMQLDANASANVKQEIDQVFHEPKVGESLE